MGRGIFIWLTCFILVLCESAFVDNLGKCSIHDGECQKNTLQSVIRDTGKSGIPDYGIPPVDPFQIKNVSINVLNILNITMVEGVAKGVKDCVIDKVDTNIEEERATLEITCDVSIKGKYKVFGDSPVIKNVLGGSTVHGDGNTKIKLDKFHIKFDYTFYIRERDGELYIDWQVKDLKYSYSLGKVTFAADNLFVGETDASDLIVNMINENWKFLMQSFGKPFLDKAMDIMYAQLHKFFDVVPTKYYLTDDLTSYVKKN